MINELNDFLRANTTMLRHGDVVEERTEGNVQVTEIFGFPPKEEATKPTVDVGFVVIELTGDGTREEFVTALKAALGDGAFGPDSAVAPEALCQGPSYIALGGWLGSQDLALQFIGALELYGLGEAILPRKLGMEAGSAMERELMGQGFLMGMPNQELRELLGTELPSAEKD